MLIKKIISFITPRIKQLTPRASSVKLGASYCSKGSWHVIRVLRIVVMAAAVLITILEFFGIRDFSRAPYYGILHHNLVIQEVDRAGPNRDISLQSGDRIRSVDGQVPRNINHFNYLTASNTSLKPQVYTIARADSIFDVTVRSVGQPQDQLSRRFAMMVVGFTFILVGFIVILRRPDILGLLFTVNCFIFSFLVTNRPVTSIGFFHIAGELLHDFLFIFLPAFFLHFFFLFPGKQIVSGTRRSAAIRVLYVPPSILFLSTFVLALMNYSTRTYFQFINAVETLTAIYWVVYMLACIVTFIRTYQTSEKVQRVKFRIVIFGVALGIVPISAVMLIKQFLPTANLPYGHLSVLFLSFISVSFAYAILKHGALDLNIVIRRGLTFVMLSALLIGLYFILVKVLGSRFNDFLGVTSRFATVIAIILLALVFAPAKAGIQVIVDRAFYKSRKVFRERVIEFNRKIQFLMSLEEISKFVVREVMELSDAKHVHIFLRENKGNYILKRSNPPARKLPLTSFPPDLDLVQLMKEKRVPLLVEYFDNLWILNNLDRISRELILISEVSVAVPLIEQQELFGFILVGRKRSGKPYIHADAEVFELLGERSAVAIRNIELYRDSIEKEKLEEELHLASQIQHRLLPDSPPSLPQSTLLGGIKTTREVGGDFYDFVEFSAGRIGIAVADVSGKGIPASMLMTTLQASFRAEASHGRSPAEVLSALNGSLYERSDPTKFATFFYAVYEDATGLLRYANGGSFPPIVLGADGKISRLQRGGILIGVEPDFRYSEGITKLKPGDLLIIYTDGFLDQENGSGEPFGEQRLIQYFRHSLQLSLANIIEKLFATVIAFGQNNVKDDMTIVLLRKNIP